MTISSSYIKLRKSSLVSDASTNGGRPGRIEVSTGVKQNIFPWVSASERSAGATRYRKLFLCNEDPDDATAHDVLLWLRAPSNAGDRIYLGAGLMRDTQAGLSVEPPAWLGAGRLHTNLTAGVSTTVVLEMESSDFQFPNGGYLYISDHYAVSQTINTAVRPGDSVQYSSGAGEWQYLSPTTDITYPKGLYLGSNTVLTVQSGHEEWLQLAANLYTDEVIGAGNGSSQTPTLSTLTHHTNGVCNQRGIRPVITAICGGSTRTVNVSATGACSGYCSAGQFNLTTGAWTTQITWTTAPDSSTDIKATYRENCYAWSGNNATVSLASGVTPANSYSTSNTYGGGCVDAGDIAAATSSWVETNVHSGTYDESGHPLILYNDGTVEDDWTVTFTGAGTFICSGLYSGSVGTGSTGNDFSPTNPDTGQPYFKLASAGWSGAWSTGDSLTFTTSPAAAGVWLEEVVPASTSAEENNFPMGWVWQ